ncbi:MAG: stage sporulation protein [Firmicutes bacterium]|nr:stage sporulation protein [Bacillota bacterium]
MSDTKHRSIFGILIALLIIGFSFSPPLRAIYEMPRHMYVIEGEATFHSIGFPLTVKVNSTQQSTAAEGIISDVLSRPVSGEPLGLGKTMVEFKLLGLIPMKTVEVDVLPPVKVIPGGHSIGVVLHSQGVIVVGHSPVQTAANDDPVSPAKDAGIVIGDVILAINGMPVQSDVQVADIIDACGQENRQVDILVKRGQEFIDISLASALCIETKRYRIGLFVRDSAAGVGTLTFYDPQTKTYGALGHVITDSDTNQPIDCERGKIVMATVSGIQQGKRGQPGEKIGVFIEEDQVLGIIRKNTPFGIYGQLSATLPNQLYSEPIPVASMSQVELGDAEILTVVDGQNIERFSIEIQKINLQQSPEGKGMVIKVTDPKLLEKTGGIVQGMSGSPIIQKGKIVGAVTHVFVHDPTKGYGCFIDWMLMESGIIPAQTGPAFNNLFTTFIIEDQKAA